MTDAAWAISIATAQVRRRLGKKICDDALRLYEGETEKICDPLVEKQRLETASRSTNQKRANSADATESRTDVEPMEQGRTSPVKPASPRRRSTTQSARPDLPTKSAQPTKSTNQ